MDNESCAHVWEAAKAECERDAGVSVPNEATLLNNEVRMTLCTPPACQRLAMIFRTAIASHCEVAVSMAALYPNGIQDPKFCSDHESKTPATITARDLEANISTPTDTTVPTPTSISPPPSIARETVPAAPAPTPALPTTDNSAAPEASPSEPVLVPTATPEATSSSPDITAAPIETGSPKVTTASPPVTTTPPSPAATTPVPEMTKPTPTNPPSSPDVTTPTPVNFPLPPSTTTPPSDKETPTPPRSVMTSVPAPASPAVTPPAPAPVPKPTEPTPSQPTPAPQIATSTPVATKISAQPLTSSTSVPQATASAPTSQTPVKVSTEAFTVAPPTTSSVAEAPLATSPASSDQPPASTQSSIPSLTDSPLPTQHQNAAQSDRGFSPTVIAVSGGVVVLVIVLAVVLVRIAQTKRRQKTVENEEELITKYRGDLNSPRTAAGTTMSVPWAGSVLATSKIPLEKIRIGPVISQGGYGEVSRGYYSGQEVAIKRLLVSRRRDLVCIHDFLEEIKLTAMLDHECIAKFIGVAWDAPSDLCMVSEFVPGGDLRSLLSRKARDGEARGFDDNKLRIAMQVAHALTYMHTLQPVVIHRDLKSRNVLLTREMDAKLIDFGVSTERCDMTMTAGVGTSLWMAPEMMLGQRYDEKADVFSFGVVLSELDTHELPYSHVRESPTGRLVNDMVVMQLVSQGKLIPRFSETADPRIVELARDCLQLDPSNRPSASEVLYLIHRTRRAGALL